jgi:hypothetical protein
VPKVARTQLRDAVPMTWAWSSGWAEARPGPLGIFKCRERIKQVNLGHRGGHRLGAPRGVHPAGGGQPEAITGCGIPGREPGGRHPEPGLLRGDHGHARGPGRQPAQIAGDLRLLAAARTAAWARWSCRRSGGLQRHGGKINPVLPEAVTQVALKVMAAGQCVTLCAAWAARPEPPPAPARPRIHGVPDPARQRGAAPGRAGVIAAWRPGPGAAGSWWNRARPWPPCWSRPWAMPGGGGRAPGRGPRQNRGQVVLDLGSPTRKPSPSCSRPAHAQARVQPRRVRRTTQTLRPDEA